MNRNANPSTTIIGNSTVIRDVLDIISKCAPKPCSVLITGETGTGKELVARLIHYSSPRKDKPFVAVNCAALPENLIESELFGHERGAFTDAKVPKTGMFESGDGGTIFLDEIGELPLVGQAKILRVLEDKVIQRVGSLTAKRIDVRILAATHRTLEKEVVAKRFREDLFYRLNVMCIRLPPLRERSEDIPLLAKHFLEQLARDNDMKCYSFSPATMQKLTVCDWPGNVRELKNAIEGAVAMTTPDAPIVTDSNAYWSQRLPRMACASDASEAPRPMLPPAEQSAPDNAPATIVFVDDTLENVTAFKAAAEAFDLTAKVQRIVPALANAQVQLACLRPSDVPRDEASRSNLFRRTVLLLMDMDFQDDSVVWATGQELLLHVFAVNRDLCLRTVWITKTGMDGLHEDYMRMTKTALRKTHQEQANLEANIPLLPFAIVESGPPPLPRPSDEWWHKVWTTVDHVLQRWVVAQTIASVPPSASGQSQKPNQGQSSVLPIEVKSPQPRKGPAHSDSRSSNLVDGFVEHFVSQLERHGNPPYETTLIKTILGTMHVDWYSKLSDEDRQMVENCQRNFTDALLVAFGSKGASFKHAGKGAANNNILRIRITTNWKRVTSNR